MAEKDEKKPEEKKEEKPAPKDNLVVTKHKVKIGGREVRYTVTAGTMILKEETADREKEAEGEKPRAQVFFVAYTKDGNGAKSAGGTPALRKRPITFSFNGGPGSSSVWLHLGVLGPRRVVLTDDGELPPPPFRLTDNQYSNLDETDLVFIDPVSTGYSRAVDGQEPKGGGDRARECGLCSERWGVCGFCYVSLPPPKTPQSPPAPPPIFLGKPNATP